MSFFKGGFPLGEMNDDFAAKFIWTCPFLFAYSLAGEIFLFKIVKMNVTKGGFPLGEMTGDFTVKPRRNYFATKLYLIFTSKTLTRLLKTSKIRLLLLKTLNQTENKD